MSLEFIEIHPADDAKLLNTEWFIVKNTGDKPFTTRGCTLEVSRKGSKKTKALGTMDPGFSIAPGESVRVITGHPGRKAHGSAPSDDTPNYNLFLGASYVKGDGTILTIRLRSLSVGSAQYQSSSAKGVA